METQAMVINCVAYKAGKRLTDVTIEDISEVVKEPDTFIWLGLWQPEDAFMRRFKRSSACTIWRSKTLFAPTSGQK